MGRERWAFLAAALSSLGWASMYPAAKVALDEVEPLHIVWARAAVAGLALALITIVSKRGLRRGWAQLRAEGGTRPWGWLLLGLMNFVGTSLLVLSAQRFLPASVNGLLNNTSPLWLALAAALLGRAIHPGRLLAGSLIALVGVGLVVIGADTAAGSAPWWQAFATADLRGVGLSLAGSVLIAIATIVARRVMPGRDAIAATSLACLAGALVCTPLVFAFAGGFALLGSVSPGTLLLLLHMGLSSTAFNFSLWFYALSVLPVTRVAPLQYLIAPLGVALSVIFLREPLTLTLVVGGTAIVAGIIIAQRGAEPVPAAIAQERRRRLRG